MVAETSYLCRESELEWPKSPRLHAAANKKLTQLTRRGTGPEGIRYASGIPPRHTPPRHTQVSMVMTFRLD